jgi:hypothetical protein
MVKHDIRVRGVDMAGTEQKCPVILQMHDDDFPARFLQDLASPGQTPISQTTIVDPAQQPLFQPVQRMLHLALVKLSCNSLNFPRVNPTRIQSAGLVIRRVFLKPGINGGQPVEDHGKLSAWMRSASGQFAWMALRPDQEILDPDPTQRRRLSSGQAELDRQLAALSLASANTESTTPAFVAPPASCASLNRTVVYAVIPTASSEVSDAQPKQPPQFDQSGLINSLPALLRSSQNASPPVVPASGITINYRWMSDDFLNAIYPATPPDTSSTNPGSPIPDPHIAPFHVFSTALRMLHSVFGAFDGTAEGNAILQVLNQHNVTFGDGSTQPMGSFYQSAKAALLDYNPYPSSSPSAPQLPMPTAWDQLNDDDQTALLTTLVAALTPRSQTLLAPQGRFQDATRRYRLRLFFRIKGETPNCPPELVWSEYSKPFRIAPWYASSERPHPPVPLPDPTSDFLANAKPNCSFQVPGNLMSAMQGTSMSGLMSGAGGGSGLNLSWICGFNIPLITICAFFVLNIFLSLLNIVFFWLPIIKICIPFPMPSSSSPDEGAP